MVSINYKFIVNYFKIVEDNYLRKEMKKYIGKKRGGIYITKGLIDEGMVTELLGGAMTLLGGIWSIVDKSKKG